MFDLQTIKGLEDVKAVPPQLVADCVCVLRDAEWTATEAVA